MRTDDGYIIRKCLEGDPVAFGLLVDKYKESIYALAYSKLLNFHDAQDITQEAFIKAYRKLHTLKRQNNFLAWLYAITSNLCKDWIRSHSKRPDREFVEDQEPEVLDKPSLFSYREGLVRQSLREALDSLPETYREALSLYYLSGMSVKEIARFLGVSPHAIDMRLNRARLKLKEEMLIMMSATFDEMKLQPGFTFRIVEIVKRINVHPFPHAPWLRWGLPWMLSLATGTILTFLGFTTLMPQLFSYNPALMDVKDSIEAKVLDTGEVPVDVAKISDVPIISNGKMDNNFDGNANLPSLRDALAFLFAPQGGEGKWTKKADMPTARMLFSTSTVNGKIYAIGGTNVWPPIALSAVEEYDPKTDKWTRKSDMPTARVALSTGIVNGKIYAIGGSPNGLVPFSIVEEYDPKTDKWTKKADMPAARMILSASVVNGKIYAIGGWNGVILSTLEEYDPKADKWTKKADMPTARGWLSPSVVNGKIYAIGGSPDGLVHFSIVEEYDPKTDKWIKKADMPTARRGLSTSVINGKIYAIGGWNGVILSTLEEYDPNTDTWTKKADTPTARGWLSTSVVNGKIYAIGGGLSPQGAAFFSTVEEYDLGFADEEVQGIDAKEKHVISWGKMKK